MTDLCMTSALWCWRQLCSSRRFRRVVEGSGAIRGLRGIETSVRQINDKVIQIESNYSDQSNLIRIKITVFLKVIRIKLNEQKK